MHPTKITLSIATASDRDSIYGIRHQVYAQELGQHAVNDAGVIRDRLDEVNVYLVAKRGDTIAGFVSITPPNSTGYSLDKYFPRAEVALAFDEGLYEVRLLTVLDMHRGANLAALLMYGAMRFVQSRGGRTIAAIGRLEVLEMYKRAGLRSLDRRITAGKVTYELMAGDVNDLQTHLAAFGPTLTRLERDVYWMLPDVPFRAPAPCYHGGAFFDAIGADFETLERKDAVINADVLDAWFDPAPAVTARLSEHLAFALKTSPPTHAEGMRHAIARARGVADEAILPGAGSSDLIFRALRHWIAPTSRVLILDPMYGEYAHVLVRVIGADVERLTLSRGRNYDVDLDELVDRSSRSYDWIVLVNPNSPTGRHIPRPDLERAIDRAPASTRWWIDETYVDYTGVDQSLERFAAGSSRVVICKSMSKAYALSGARAAYLCGPPAMINEIAPLCPPWSVSLPAQIAACEALKATEYYRARWAETHELREELSTTLRSLGWDVTPGCGNFVLCHLPAAAPDAPLLVKKLRARGLYVRDVATMGSMFENRAIRIAVKDRATNAAMLTLIEATADVRLTADATRWRSCSSGARRPAERRRVSAEDEGCAADARGHPRAPAASAPVVR